MCERRLVVAQFGIVYFVFFKQKTAYEMRISDWSSDVCSSDLAARHRLNQVLDYIEATNPETVCAEIDELWLHAFRRWALEQPVKSPTGVVLRERPLAHVEGGVMQLAAAIQAPPGQRAMFTSRQQTYTTRSPPIRVAAHN